MADEDKKLVWLEAMQNVAAGHHALIVTEYNRLMRERGLDIGATSKRINLDIGATSKRINNWIYDWLIADKKSQTQAARAYSTRVIQCIKAVREQFVGLGLKEAKDAVDAVRKEMTDAGEL